ncbi:hypothetical protein NKI89_01735 [Mesorhizobium sp. M0309]|uniref:hypothetical protein n=1 Tax=Mesorhizobium sp. M0309 TaxID=2956933 RepID=UPI00333919A4
MWHGNTPYGGGGQPGPRTKIEKTYPRALSLPLKLARLDFRSITVPNARCPVCGISVFFYQNRFGSRVFFDDLGPPWPKHPCTDTSTWRANKSAAITAPAKQPKYRADWIEKWLPAIIESAEIDILNVRTIAGATALSLRLDRPFAGCAIDLLYLQKASDLKYRVSLLGSSGEPEAYFGIRTKPAGYTPLSGFLLYCQREREICRAIDARKELAEIKANRHSNRRLF